MRNRFVEIKKKDLSKSEGILRIYQENRRNVANNFTGISMTTNSYQTAVVSSNFIANVGVDDPQFTATQLKYAAVLLWFYNKKNSCFFHNLLQT